MQLNVKFIITLVGIYTEIKLTIIIVITVA